MQRQGQVRSLSLRHLWDSRGAVTGTVSSKVITAMGGGGISRGCVCVCVCVDRACRRVQDKRPEGRASEEVRFAPKAGSKIGAF